MSSITRTIGSEKWNLCFVILLSFQFRCTCKVCPDPHRICTHSHPLDAHVAAKEAAALKKKSDMESWKLIFQKAVEAESARERQRQEQKEAQRAARQKLKDEMEAERVRRMKYMEYSYETVCDNRHEPIVNVQSCSTKNNRPIGCSLMNWSIANRGHLVMHWSISNHCHLVMPLLVLRSSRPCAWAARSSDWRRRCRGGRECSVFKSYVIHAIPCVIGCGV